MTTSASPTLTKIEGIFQNLVWQPAIHAALDSFYLTPAGIWLIWTKGAVYLLVDKFSNWVYSKVVLFLDIADIKLTNALHQAAYDAASVKLLVIAQEKGVKSAVFLAAQKDEQAKLAVFLSLT